MNHASLGISSAGDVDTSLCALVGALYETAFDPSNWELALERMAAMMGASAAIMMLADTSRPGATAVYQIGNDPAAIAQYNETWSTIDPLVSRVPYSPLGTWVVDRSDTRYASAIEQAYHHDFLERNGVSSVEAVLLARDSERVATVSIQRTTPVSENERNIYQRRMEPVMPHLKRAAQLHFELEALHLRERILDSSLNALRLPIAVVNSDCGIILMNRRAEQLLTDPSATLCVRNRRLIPQSSRPAFEAAVHRACGNFAVGNTVRLSCSLDRKPYGVGIVPLGNMAPALGGRIGHAALLMMYAAHPASRDDTTFLAGLFGLTPGEARLAILLLSGLSAREAAELLEVEISTVRTHLKAIFAKTGCHSQGSFLKVAAEAIQMRPAV